MVEREQCLLAVFDLAPLLARRPELIVLGTGAVQAFPPQATLAACLQQGVGIEVMNNESAAVMFSMSKKNTLLAKTNTTPKIQSFLNTSKTT